MKNNYKTIKDLVNLLNENNKEKNFYVDDFTNIGLCVINETDNDETHQLVQFNEKNKTWHTMALFGLENNKVQKEIMDFIYTTDSNYWFDELTAKKYNIVIGKDVYGHYKSAYYKGVNGVKVLDSVCGDNLTLDDYMFTETEIEDLKATLPENMAKIVDLGKVEVTNENN